ncbi:DUF3159 domain-containing protein [Nocardia sp. NPDC004068]|uniref:DUF3159 domain-containing protein n=1 Tax=Nocardia sp. NPDC004068 TaxID=3364303 RepID=UPI0036A28EC2
MRDGDETRSDAGEIWGKFRALGGVGHLVDGAVPALGFLVGYAVWNAKIGVVVALVLAVLLAGLRTWRGESAKVVMVSVAAVIVFSLFVGITGEGRGFYLPDLLVCAAGAVLFGGTVLIGRPLSQWVCRRIGLEPAEHADPAARRALHRRVSLAWFAFWAAHLLILVPLYVANEVVLLGSVALVLGKPALVVMLAVTWLWVRRSLRPRVPTASA